MLHSFNDAKAKDNTDAVLRDLRQPRHLPRRLARRDRPPGALGDEAARDARQTTSGSSTTRARDFSLANDLAAKNPAKLKEMQALFMKEAEKNAVLPIDDRAMERLNPAARRHGPT